VKASFQIRLHSKDKARALRLFSKGTFEKILEQIKSYFCAGRIYKQESESVQLRVESVKDLAKVLDHFVRSKVSFDYAETS